MPHIEIIKPISQPTDEFRLLNWLNERFSSTTYHSFRCLVAFAKVKPLYKMHENIQKWNASGNHTEAIIGVDHKGTSLQALQYALANFQHTYVLHTDHSTFHPKMYIFSGETEAAVYYGSNNLTPGGLETNFEGGVILTLTFPEDADLFDQAMASFESLLPSSIPCCVELTNTILQQLNNGGWLLDESIPKAVRNLGAIRRAGYTTSTPSLFAPYKTKLPKAISKTALAVAAASAGITTNPIGSGTPVTPVISHTAASPAVPIAIVEGLVMQVVPHHNGEIFLSMNAIRQNPGFFGFPFTGQTVPKKATNPTYPQRDPDPIVNIFVYDAAGTCVRTEIQYNLNTVFYEKKAEIRITITPSILRGLNYTGGSDYPIMVMRNSETDECDYDLHFYAKGSTDYSSCLSICDQALPSGGKPVARKMGWI